MGCVASPWVFRAALPEVKLWMFAHLVARGVLRTLAASTLRLLSYGPRKRGAKALVIPPLVDLTSC